MAKRHNMDNRVNTVSRINTRSRVNMLSQFNTHNRIADTRHVGSGVVSGVVNTPGQSITRHGPTTAVITAVAVITAAAAGITVAAADAQAVTVVVATMAGAGNETARITDISDFFRPWPTILLRPV
jgi:hypothetical protein